MQEGEYEVCEDYTSYEEYDLPPPKKTTTTSLNTQKPIVKNVINLATNNTKASATAACNAT